MLNPFELTKIMFEKPEEYEKVSLGDKKKNFFIVQRRMAIKYPMQAHLLQHLKINEAGVIDFWQSFLRKIYNKTPFWMFTKGIKKTQKEKEKKLNIKEDLIVLYSMKNGYDLKSVREAINMYPQKMKKELSNFEKSISS